MTWRTLLTIAHSFMIHARVLEAYIFLAFMYTADYILPVLPINYLTNKDGKVTTPFKLATGMKPSVSHLRVLFFPCVIRKATAHVRTKALNMRHQAQKGFRSNFFGNTQHQKGYLVYVLHRRRIISSYDVVFDHSLSITLVYTSQPYTEAMYMHPAMSYIPYAKYSRETNGDIITFL